jgi:acyl-CoA thioester hydrolase
VTDVFKAEDFPCLIREKVRYSDTDRQSHVNNVLFAVFFEAGRVELLFNYGDVLEEGCSFVLARSEIDFLRELNWPGHVTIGTRVHRLGRSSISIEQAQKHGETGTSKALSDAARSLFEQFSVADAS